MAGEKSCFDLIIRDGTIIDGTGKNSYKADIGILGEKIIKIGNIKGSAIKEINASNLFVTPGFVDIHTHYDGQAIWDNYL